MIPFMMLLASFDTDPNGIIWHQDQWHDMMSIPLAVVLCDQKAMLHLILIVLAYGM